MGEWLQEGDDEDMSDEQMFRMDKMIAAVLRTQKDAKEGAKKTRQVNIPPWENALGKTDIGAASPGPMPSFLSP